MITFLFGCHCQSENIFGSHSGNLKANRNFLLLFFLLSQQYNPLSWLFVLEKVSGWGLVRRPDLWNPMETAAKPLKVTFNGPANHWTDALPIGNGRLGAMVWGGVASETLQLNGTICNQNHIYA